VLSHCCSWWHYSFSSYYQKLKGDIVEIFGCKLQWFHIGLFPATYEWLFLPIFGGLLKWYSFFSFTVTVVGIAFTCGAILCSKTDFEYKYKSPTVASDQGAHSFTGNFSQIPGTAMVAFFLGGYNADGISEESIDEGVLIVPKAHCETRGPKLVLVHTKTKLLSLSYIPHQIRDWLVSIGLENVKVYYGTLAYADMSPESIDLEKQVEESNALTETLCDLLAGKLSILEDFRSRSDRIAALKHLPEELKRKWGEVVKTQEDK